MTTTYRYSLNICIPIKTIEVAVLLAIMKTVKDNRSRNRMYIARYIHCSTSHENLEVNLPNLVKCDYHLSASINYPFSAVPIVEAAIT